jgi:hypothetical protein
MTRAFLLAKATAATLGPRSRLSRLSHALRCVFPRTAVRKAARAIAPLCVRCAGRSEHRTRDPLAEKHAAPAKGTLSRDPANNFGHLSRGHVGAGLPTRPLGLALSGLAAQEPIQGNPLALCGVTSAVTPNELTNFPRHGSRRFPHDPIQTFRPPPHPSAGARPLLLDDGRALEPSQDVTKPRRRDLGSAPESRVNPHNLDAG